VNLGERGVYVYEISDWVEVEDLGMEDDTHPEDVCPSR
jgi:hypothetical protein